MHIALPYSGLEEWVQEDSAFQEINDAFGIDRLRHIRSLSFLSYRMILGPDSDHVIHDEFRHDRYSHSLAAGLVMDKMLKRNKITGRDYLLGLTAALTHDLATPAGGDAIKSLDPESLHEETHWREMLGDEAWAFLDKHSISPEEVESVIANEGPLGEMLDIADRLTYTMQDARELGRGPITVEPGLDIDRVIKGHNRIGDLYADVQIDPTTGRPYCNDSERLGHFLVLRAAMHYDLYMNPITAGRDWVIARFMEPFYTTGQPTVDQPITPTLLRRWGDDDLMKFLCEKYDVSHFPSNFFYQELSSWQPSYETFKTPEEARAELSKMQENPEITILDTITKNGFKTGEQYLTKDNEGNIRPFSEVDPKITELLRIIAEETNETHIFYVDKSDRTNIGRMIREQRLAGTL